MDTYRKFYQIYKEKLFSYLVRMTGNYELSRDTMQESFTRYMERYGQETLNGKLLFTIGRNILFDNLRKQKKNTALNFEPTDNSPDQEHTHLIREEYRSVLAAMEALDTKDRDILALTVSSNMTYREIASIMRISESAVKVRVHRARIKVRTIMKEGDP